MIQAEADYIPPTPLALAGQAGRIFKDNFKFLAIFSLIMAAIFVALNMALAVLELTMIMRAGSAAGTGPDELLNSGASLLPLIVVTLAALAAWCFLAHIFLYGQSRILFKIWNSEYPEYEDIFRGFSLIPEVSRIMLANLFNLLIGGGIMLAAYVPAIRAAAFITGLPYQLTVSPFTLFPPPQYWAPLLLMLIALVFLAFVVFRRYGFLVVFFGYFRLYDDGGLARGEPVLKDLIDDLLRRYRPYYNFGLLICLLPPLVAGGLDTLFAMFSLSNQWLIIFSVIIKSLIFWLAAMWVLLYLAGVYADVLKPRPITYTNQWTAEKHYF